MPSSVLFRSGWYRSRPRTSLRSPGAADHTIESGAAAAAPAPNPNSRSGDGGQQAAPAGRSDCGSLCYQRRWEYLEKETLEKEIGEAPPSRLERVGLLAERVGRLRLARARRVCH